MRTHRRHRWTKTPSAYLAAYAAWAREKYEYLPMRGLGGLRLDLRLEDVHIPLELMPRERGRSGLDVGPPPSSAVSPGIGKQCRRARVRDPESSGPSHAVPHR
jgi:hypothetical protein